MAKQRYAFDEALLSAFHLAQQRKQEENQFKQKMAFEMRQLNLLDAFRQKDYDLRNKGFLADQINAGRDLEGKRLKAQDDYTPFNTLQDVPENIRNNAFSGSEYPSLLGGDKFYVPNSEIPKQEKPTVQKGARLIPKYGGQVEESFEIDPVTGKEIVTGYGNFYKPDKATDGSSGTKTTDPEVSKFIQTASELLTNFKNKNYTKYEDWKAEASGVTSGLLNKAGLNKNSAILNKIRMVANDDDPPEVKRQLFNEAFQDDELKKEFKLTPEQEEAIRYWIELDTR